jgi:hypothetical protein
MNNAHFWRVCYPRYLQHIHSPYWYDLKERRSALVGGRCEKCGCSDKSALELHHVRPYRDCLFRETVDDVALWCGPCHSAEHGTTRRKVEYIDASELGISDSWEL